MARLARVLARLFPAGGWDGRIASDLIDDDGTQDLAGSLLIKCDHALPMAGSGTSWMDASSCRSAAGVES